MTTDSAPPEKLWWQTGVIYQVYPRSFKDTNGDGIGDLAGVIEQLDYLSDTLGVDAIWLSPFYPSPMKDFGYDVADYTDVAPIFGDLETFDQLLAEAHRRGLRLIIDLVPNHTSDQHPWFIESRSSRNTPKRDWYIWRDPKPDGSPPNNWVSHFGGPAWEWDEHTGQYYLHLFLKEQPDLNWRNPAVREAFFDVVRFWLERGVDGFRIDVAHYILKDPELRDNPPNPQPASWAAYRPVAEYDRYLHLYDKGHPDVHEVYRQLRKVLDEYSLERPRLSIGEIHIFDWPVWASYYGENLDELHMPFNFALIGAKWQALSVRQIVDTVEATLPAAAWPNYVLGNHDEMRLVSRIGPQAARAAAVLLLTLRGTPTIYYGEEIGMEDAVVPPEREQDPWGLRAPGLSRDPQRSPMQWTPGPNAGFSPPQVEQLWLPLAENYRQVNVEVELQDPRSMLNLYRRLLRLRKERPALQWGDYLPVARTPEDCFVYLRRAEGSPAVLVAINFSAGSRRFSLPPEMQGRRLLSSYLDQEQGESLPEIALRGNEAVIFELTGEYSHPR